MNKWVKKVVVVLFLLLTVSVVSCAEIDGKGNGAQASVPEDDFKAALDAGKDSELYNRYEEYKENATLAFKSNAECGAADFEYEICENEVMIKKYIGGENIVVLPMHIDSATVTSIAEGAFEGTSIRALYIPDTVKKIEKGALSGCDTLVTLRLPFIGDGGNNTHIGYIFGANSFDVNAVSVPPSLDMLIIGEGTDEIGENAFRGCKTLSAVILSDSVTKIDDLAFYECADLVYLSLPKRVESVGKYSFAYCRSLYSVDLTAVSEVGDGALYSCASLNTLGYNPTEEDYLGRIFGAESVEYNCDFVPESLRNINIAEGCKKIGDMTFASCKYLTSVSLPESLESVGVRAFYACRSLSGIDLPDSVKSVGDDAFFGCDAMSFASFGKSLESLGMQAFYGCKSLRKAILPQSLKEIKSSTFYGCKSLEVIELGGVKTVGKDAFGGCDALLAVSCDGIDVGEGNGALTGNKQEN